ncbi:Global transcription regulator sge1 [Zalaria obscura]|uniref:Global transcription regulator sge1 n=1 Tax=Zalaria obscura TaxID=2024903 RepID=A0ACC3SH56_9PEZI
MSGGSGSGPLVPTFHGFVQNSMDALILFEACLSGKLHHVPRRPHDRERGSLIKSGSIFIYEENASGIKRWTDGVAWSPSRILGNFLIYRELEKPFPPGEKKRAMKRKRDAEDGLDRRDSADNETSEVTMPPTPPTPNMHSTPLKQEPTGQVDGASDKEIERQLVGSLVDSYGFREDGLVKKTMSVSLNGVSHHLVSYYRVDEVKSQVLKRPMADPRLTGIAVRPDLFLKQNFRAPLEDNEHYAIDGNMNALPGIQWSQMYPTPYPMARGPYMQAVPMYSPQQHSSPGAQLYSGVPTSSWSSMPPSTVGPSQYSAPPYNNTTSAYAPTRSSVSTSTVGTPHQYSATPQTSMASPYSTSPLSNMPSQHSNMPSQHSNVSAQHSSIPSQHSSMQSQHSNMPPQHSNMPSSYPTSSYGQPNSYGGQYNLPYLGSSTS